MEARPGSLQADADCMVWCVTGKQSQARGWPRHRDSPSSQAGAGHLALSMVLAPSETTTGAGATPSSASRITRSAVL